MVVNLGRDLNIGYPNKETINIKIVDDKGLNQNITEVNGNLEVITEELKKVRLGTGLVTGTDLSEQEVE